MQITHLMSPCHSSGQLLMSLTWCLPAKHNPPSLYSFKYCAENCALYCTKFRGICFQFNKFMCVARVEVWVPPWHSTYMEGRGRGSGVGSCLPLCFEIQSLMLCRPPGSWVSTQLSCLWSPSPHWRARIADVSYCIRLFSWVPGISLLACVAKPLDPWRHSLISHPLYTHLFF